MMSGGGGVGGGGCGCRKTNRNEEFSRGLSSSRKLQFQGKCCVFKVKNQESYFGVEYSSTPPLHLQSKNGNKPGRKLPNQMPEKT